MQNDIIRPFPFFRPLRFLRALALFGMVLLLCLLPSGASAKSKTQSARKLVRIPCQDFNRLMVSDETGDELKNIAYSANAFEEGQEKSLRVGMDGHLAKPLKIAEFLAELQRFS